MSKALPRLLLLVVLALLLAPVGSARAQTIAPLEVHIREVSFNADGTTEVTVSLAGSALGTTVLSASNFSVTEEGKAVTGLRVEPLSAKTSRSVSVALLMDISGSTGRVIGQAKTAAKDFVSKLPDRVRTSLISFGGPDAILNRDFQPLSSARGAMLTAIDALQAYAVPGTRLYDAVVIAARGIGSQSNTQGNIVIFSDGQIGPSDASLAEAIAEVRATGASVTSVMLSSATAAEGPLRSLAQAQEGGRFLRVENAAGLASAFSGFAQAISTQYVLTYPASATTPNDLDLSVSATVGAASAGDASTVVNERAAAAPSRRPVDQPGPLVPAFANDVGLYIGVLAAFVALLMFIAMLVYRPAGKRAEQILARGLRMYTKGTQKKKKAADDTGFLASTAAGRAAVGLVERVPRSKKFEENMQRQLEQAGWPLRSTEFILLQIGGVAVGAILGFGLFARWWLGLVLMIVGAIVPRVLLANTITKRSSAFLEQLPDTLQLLSGSLQAGYGFMQALDTVSKEAQAPTSTEFSRVLSEARLGMPVEEALDAMAERVGGEDFKWVVLAINIQRQVGGNLAALLQTVAQTLREREQVRRQIKVLSAEGRLSAIILVALPFVLVGYLQVVNPRYLSALTSETIGQIGIAASLVLIGLGIVWMRKIINIDV